VPQTIEEPQEPRWLRWRSESQEPRWLRWLSESKRLDFVPVVVTTAKLLLCHFDATKVDLQSGRLAVEDSRFEERPWIVYDYPLTGGLAFDPDDVQSPPNMEANPLEIATKMHVLFLQSDQLPALAGSDIAPLFELLERD